MQKKQAIFRLAFLYSVEFLFLLVVCNQPKLIKLASSIRKLKLEDSELKPVNGYLFPYLSLLSIVSRL